MIGNKDKLNDLCIPCHYTDMYLIQKGIEMVMLVTVYKPQISMVVVEGVESEKISRSYFNWHPMTFTQLMTKWA